jgi:hypothetical protein
VETFSFCENDWNNKRNIIVKDESMRREFPNIFAKPLDHPNVLQSYDWLEDHREFYSVTDCYYSGGGDWLDYYVEDQGVKSKWRPS